MAEVMLTVSVDTEEDNWGSYDEGGATTRNIDHLVELHERIAACGARPTYLVNRPPLVSSRSVRTLGALAEREEVEVGGHCHPWNTPPATGHGREHSMMCRLPTEANTAKVGEVTRLIESELGVRPRSFRAGRWGFGPSVALAIAHHGYVVDASVTPFLDWSGSGGPDYSLAPSRPYRFHPAHPLVPSNDGPMVELPTTIGFLGGDRRRRASIRRFVTTGPLRYLKPVPLLETVGLLRRRWLSPETSSAKEMLALTQACLKSGEPTLDLTFHSCTLLPGATPFVRDEHDRRKFCDAIETVLRFCGEAGVAFRTLSEAGQSLLTQASRPSP